MKSVFPVIVAASLALSGMGLAGNSQAAQGMMGMHGKDMHAKHHASSHNWKSTLSDEQQAQYAKLKLAFKKQVLPVKAKLKQARIDKALLMTADSPNQKEINKKIDEILKLKGEKMRLKTEYKLNVRKMLNAEQRVAFDLYLLKKASHGKRCKHHH